MEIVGFGPFIFSSYHNLQECVKPLARRIKRTFSDGYQKMAIHFPTNGKLTFLKPFKSNILFDSLRYYIKSNYFIVINIFIIFSPLTEWNTRFWIGAEELGALFSNPWKINIVNNIKINNHI